MHKDFLCVGRYSTVGKLRKSVLFGIVCQVLVLDICSRGHSNPHITVVSPMILRSHMEIGGVYIT